MTLARGTVARYAVGSVGTGGFGTLPGLVLVFYLTDTLGVAAGVAGLLVTAAKVWDVLVDPVIGAASDRERATTGRRRRLMVAGGVALPLFFLLTFAVPAGLAPAASALWVLGAFLLAATAFSLFQVPYIALPAEIAGTYDARTRLLTARVVVLSAAILLFGGGGPALRELGGDDERLGYLVMAAAAALVLGAAMLVSSTVERSAGALAAPTGDPAPGHHVLTHYRDGVALLRTSRPFRTLLAAFVLQALATGAMLAAAQYVATWVLRDTAAVTFLFVALVGPALVCTPLWGRVARRVGKERAFGLASAVFLVAALALVGLAWAPGAWVYVPVAAAGGAYSGMQALPMAMLPDVIAHDARTRGTGRAGTFGGVWTAGETTGMALGTTLLTAVLAATGYVASTDVQSVTQPASAVVGVVAGFSVVPALLVALSLVPLARYPLRRADIDDDGGGGDTVGGEKSDPTDTTGRAPTTTAQENP
ncbi:MFS transporter [Isoptericola sp. NEAU-Y5]|uniref:MFS transporter n=1 Tax=Isoptericola luteus TaxID=2879484 RepID=A0ABS7ZF54_9MICO|nr:MFS transporter [Isoptericola sp. NEAU-Y5]MCA5893657.1 MFS transporter [Isoptericola sp. NEAU-Y5]